MRILPLLLILSSLFLFSCGNDNTVIQKPGDKSPDIEVKGSFLIIDQNMFRISSISNVQVFEEGTWKDSVRIYLNGRMMSSYYFYASPIKCLDVYWEIEEALLEAENESG